MAGLATAPGTGLSKSVTARGFFQTLRFFWSEGFLLGKKRPSKPSLACTDGFRQQRHCQGFIPRSEVCFFTRRRLLHFHGNPADPGTDVENVCAAPESVDGTGLVCRCCRSLWQRRGVAILVVALC